MTHNNGDISLKDIIDFSFNPGLLEPVDGKPVLKMKLSLVLLRINNYTAPKSWGWNV